MTLPRRSLFWCPLLRLVGLGSFRRFPVRSLSLLLTSFFPIFWNFVRRLSLQVNPLPRSFCMCSLADFVGDLPEELLLCPVCALRLYLSRTASISPHPRSLFVSPRSSSRALSKNVLSFFLRDLSTRASFSSSAVGSLSSSSACSSSLLF